MIEAPFKFTRVQTIIDRCKSRFLVVCAGRRLGKTRWAVERMLQKASIPDSNIWYVAPTYKQAKSIAWKMLLRRLKPLKWIAHQNNIDLEITLKNGSVISLKGANNADTLRGVGVHYMIIDEPADIHEEVWTLVLRPMLSDTLGGAAFIGTPKGRNWFYRMYKRGIDEMEVDYSSFHFTTLQGENVSKEEVESARRDMDPLSFKQEYEADFLTFIGRCYYPFNYDDHVTNKLDYNENNDLILCFDFNVSPGICSIIQEQTLCTIKKRENGRIVEEDIHGTGIIDEIYIPRNSTTKNVCNKILEKYRNHRGKVKLYGDATGGAQGTAKVEGSDWDLIQKYLKPVFGTSLIMNVPKANPSEKSRVNAVNTRLSNADNQIRLLIHSRCEKTIEDFEGVQLLEGGSGEIDKKINPKLTHITDAIGYYIIKEYPVLELPKTSTSKIRGWYG